MSNPTYIKVTVTARVAAEIDEAVREGRGRSRADVCRLAVMEYLKSLEATA